MKHNVIVTAALVVFFILSQVVGLTLISTDANVASTKLGNETITTVTHADTSIGARPETKGFGSFLYLAIGIAIGTLLVLLLVKYQQAKLWKVWFFIAVWLALSIAIGVFLKSKVFFDYDVALFISLILAAWKVFKPNVVIHNLTEVLMYAGIALLIVPIFNVLWAIIMLLAISLYDMYAVWKSKHMVKMAKFQTKSEVFAGLMINYKAKPEPEEIIGKMPKRRSGKSSALDRSFKTSGLKEKPKTAILGGGDVAFPLIFTGVVMEQLLTNGLTKSAAFLQSSIIVLTTAVALTLLFVYAKKDRFYPAMPFITAGCLIGWVIVLII